MGVDSIGIRRAIPEESDALTALSFQSKAHWGYDQAFLHATRDDLIVTPEFITRYPTYVADSRDTSHDTSPIMGFYGLEPLGRDTMELEFLFVAPRHIGEGVGRRLLEHARSTARELGHRFIHIISDPNAEGFYRAMGASPHGQWKSPVIPGRTLPILLLDCTDR